MNTEDIKTVLQFLQDGEKERGSKISEDQSGQIKAIFDHFDGPDPRPGDFVVRVNVGGIYGNITATCVEEAGSSFGLMTIVSGTERTVLWTDKSEKQPFDRQGVFYVGRRFSGMSLASDGPSVREFRGEWREMNHGFDLQPFRYNSHYGTVHFVARVHKEGIVDFLSALGSILGKSPGSMAFLSGQAV